MFVLVGFCSLLNSVIWEIKQDGTGNFTTIQEGIIAATDSDTILVYPETYYENIDFSGKNITVASLYLTTGNEEYMYNTIIDGSQNGSCVRIMSEEDSTTVLCGFTLTNGNGTLHVNDYLGGGIYIVESQPIITNCLITNNVAKSGGGLCCRFSDITLSKTKIINNHAYMSGGGISLLQYSNITFDNENLCDIYFNYSSGACEIFKNWQCPALEVFVDTFTVFEPDDYFVGTSSLSGPPPPNDIIMNIQNAKLEPVNADLFVSTNGNNNNSGLSENEPLANINYALSLVKSDTLHPNTLHIADGLYSDSMNNQKFPLCMRGYVSLIGESMENTILDAEGICYLIHGYSKLNFTIKQMTLTGGNGDDFPSACIKITAGQQQNRYIILEDINLINFPYYPSRLLEIHYVDTYIKRIINQSNYHILLRAINSYQPEQEVIIENAYIHDNSQYSPEQAAHCQMEFGLINTEQMNVNIINLEMTENQYYFSLGLETCSGMIIRDNINLNLINCTIGNNTSPNNGGVIRIGPDGQNSVVNIYNSILYGDNPGEIYIDNESSSNPSTVNIHHSLVDGGYEGIENIYNWNIVNWMEGNLNEEPCWDTTGDNPYALMGNSPCINAGTLDLPAGVELPEFDLAGNPRIYDETIDMGAYEYQDTVSVLEEIITPITQTKISNYPNPFNPTTTIELDLAESGKIELAIYNIKGQKIKTLLNAYSCKGHFEIIWRGIDDNKKKVASGQYFIKLKVNGKESAVSKCILLK